MLIPPRARICVGVAAATSRAVLRPRLRIGLVGHERSRVGAPFDGARLRPMCRLPLCAGCPGAASAASGGAGRDRSRLTRIVMANGWHEPVVVDVVFMLPLLRHDVSPPRTVFESGSAACATALIARYNSPPLSSSPRVTSQTHRVDRVSQHHPRCAWIRLDVPGYASARLFGLRDSPLSSARNS